MDLIIEAMRNTDEPMKERTKNAQWIVATMMASLKEAIVKPCCNMCLKAQERITAKEVKSKDVPEMEDDEDEGGALFSLSLSSNSQE